LWEITLEIFGLGDFGQCVNARYYQAAGKLDEKILGVGFKAHVKFWTWGFWIKQECYIFCSSGKVRSENFGKC
jgi:hypothetical protein